MTGDAIDRNGSEMGPDRENQTFKNHSRNERIHTTSVHDRTVFHTAVHKQYTHLIV